MAKKDKVPNKVKKAKMTEKTWTANIATVAKLATFVRKTSVVKRARNYKMAEKKLDRPKSSRCPKCPGLPKKPVWPIWPDWPNWPKWSKSQKISRSETDQNVPNCQSGQRSQ